MPVIKVCTVQHYPIIIGILSGIRLLHIIVKRNFSFSGYNHTRKYVQYMIKFRINQYSQSG